MFYRNEKYLYSYLINVNIITIVKLFIKPIMTNFKQQNSIGTYDMYYIHNHFYDGLCQTNTIIELFFFAMVRRKDINCL